MRVMMLIAVTVLLSVVGRAAYADCNWEGTIYPVGSFICVNTRVNICKPNGTWGVDRDLRCYRDDRSPGNPG
jgi:hypothetical protein